MCVCVCAYIRVCVCVMSRMGLVSPNTISHRTISLLGSLCQAFSPCPAAQLQVRRIGSWGRNQAIRSLVREAWPNT